MEKTYKKLNVFELEVSKELPQPEVVKVIYERGFIENQIVTIQADLDRYTEAREREIKECLDMDEQDIVKKEDMVFDTISPKIAMDVLTGEEIIK
jgi:pyrroline-5-carboxylate reductase